jgi:hypothetical protein
LRDCGSPGVFPLLVGGEDFIPESAWSELVDWPVLGVGLVVKACPGSGVGSRNQTHQWSSSPVVGVYSQWQAGT